jgi:predicted MFS family arabinose efflux permease
VFQALRIPDFRLLWGGGLISSLGSWLLVLAVPAHILAATGSLRDTRLALAAQYLPRLLLGPVAGAIADGWNRRRLMIGANLFCAGAVAVMLLGTSPGRCWVLYAALVAESTGTVLYAPALQARVPAIVGTGPLLSSANSLTSASSGIVRLIGGPLGGVLLAACGIRWLICADAVSYLLAAGAMLMTSRPGCGHPDRTAVVGAVARGLIEGTRVLRAQPAARALLPVTVIFLTANASLSAVLIPFGVQRLGGSEHAGLLLSCLGAGFLLGAPVIRAFLDRAEPRNLLTATLTATAGAYFLLFTSSSLAIALPAAAAVAMAGSMTLVIQQTVLQRVIPGAVLGRVSAVFLTGEAAATLVGSVAGPFLAQAAHLVAVAAAASLVTISAAALALRTVPQMTAAVLALDQHGPGAVVDHAGLGQLEGALLGLDRGLGVRAEDAVDRDRAPQRREQALQPVHHPALRLVLGAGLQLGKSDVHMTSCDGSGANPRQYSSPDRNRWVPGAGERDRTADLPFTRRLLCQLSYTGG